MIPYFEPPKFHLGPLTIHGFGVLVAIGIILGTTILDRRSRRLGLNPDTASRMVGWVLVMGFVVAHLVENLVYSWPQTVKDPIRLLKVWEGISSYGGFLGAVLGAWWFIRRTQLGKDTWRYLDAIVYAFPFGWFFGRMGCFSAHDHPGIRSEFFLAVQRKPPKPPELDLGLIEALYTLIIVALFVLWGRQDRRPGFFAGWMCILYAPVRFGLDFLRVVDVRYLGLTPGQYASVALLAGGVYILRLSARGALEKAA